MLNRIVLIGRLTRDPELRYTNSGIPVCNFTLAVERNYKNSHGEYDVDFIDIVTWRGLAENCSRHLGKGRLVGVDGQINIRKNENNNRVYVNPEVNADNVRFLDYSNNSYSNNISNQKYQNSKVVKQDNNFNQKKLNTDFETDFNRNFNPDDFDVNF